MQWLGCDRGAFDEHKSAGFKVWRRRSRHRWKLDLGKYEHLVDPARKPSPPNEDEIAFQNILELREEIKTQRDRLAESGASKQEIEELSRLMLALNVKLSHFRLQGNSEGGLSPEDFM